MQFSDLILRRISESHATSCESDSLYLQQSTIGQFQNRFVELDEIFVTLPLIH